MDAYDKYYVHTPYDKGYEHWVVRCRDGLVVFKTCSLQQAHKWVKKYSYK